MMTGDRMINLAKTPANNDFRSKHHKPIEPIPLLDDECASLPSSPPLMISPEREFQQERNVGKTDSEILNETGFSDSIDESGNVSNMIVKLRAQPQRNRSAVR